MKKPISAAISVAAVTFLLIYVALYVKLVTLGSSTFSGDIGPSFLPFGHIETSREGFSLENKIGSIVVPLAVGAVTWAALQWKQRARSKHLHR